MANQMIRIRLKAYDHQLIDSSAAKIVERSEERRVGKLRVHCDDAGDCVERR